MHYHRNLKIMELVLNGETLKQVAEKNNLTPARVHQIVAKTCRQRNRGFYFTMQECSTASIKWLRINKAKFIG